MKQFYFIFLCFVAQSTNATIYQIGSDKPYLSPNELYSADLLNDGDTIYIDAEEYIGNNALAVWQANNLLIRGIGGRPHLKVNGEYIWGKGIWVFGGNNIIVENIEFSGATVPDKNGAGIRLDGVGVTVRHCYFHDNENGILTSNPGDGDILVEYTEFGHNGYGEGFTHNIYVGHVNSFTFQYNYTHHAKVGHCIKSRANENYILYNRIMDEETGYASRLIDLSNGGLSVVMGNLMMQGTEAINNNLIGYGLEGLSNEGPNELYFVNNTCVNERVASCIFIHLEAETEEAVIANNIFAGSGTILNGEASNFTNNLEGEVADFNFWDAENFNYQLLENSTAIDAGVELGMINGISLLPNKSYMHPTNFENRMLFGFELDAGAYEFGMVSTSEEMAQEDLIIYPNPTSTYLNFPEEFLQGQFQITGQTGKVFLTGSLNQTKLNVQTLPFGVYFVEIVKEEKRKVFRFFRGSKK